MLESVKSVFVGREALFKTTKHTKTNSQTKACNRWTMSEV